MRTPSGPSRPPARGVLVSAPRSGSGKTVVTLGLQRALRRRGYRVAGVKAGPDYIDTAFATAACGVPAFNLDGVAMPPEALAGWAAMAGADADLVVAEGAMGLFDGVGAAGAGSSAMLAGALGWPVVLVLDAAGAGQSVAAQAEGLARFRNAPAILGAIANRIASPRHGRMVRAGFAAASVPLLGLVPADPRLSLPSRHLGLVGAGETADLDGRLDAVAALLEESCDVGALVAGARPLARPDAPPPPIRPPGQRIAVARDAAFAFLYPHLLDGWRRAGAEIAVFSPLADEPPPDDADVVWLPGGYPELHAGRLAAAARFRDGLRRFAGTRPVHGECGGYMVLGRSLEDADGRVHAMADLLPVRTSMMHRRLTLGYRRATWRAAVPFAAAGATSTGHVFHYATVTEAGGEPLADLRDGEGAELPPAGTRAGHVTGTFFHLVA